MQKSQIDSVALLAAVLGGALALLRIPGPYVWFASIVGLILFLVLLAYDREGYRTMFQSVAFSAVCGFAAMLASAGVLQLLADRGEVHLANDQWVSSWMPLIWIFSTAVLVGIDRARLSGTGRKPQELRRPLPVHGGFITDFSSPQPPVQQPAPPEPMPAATMYGVPAVSGAASQQTVSATPPHATETTPEPMAGEVPPVAPAPTMPITAPTTGKESMIYVTLLGEGLNVLRSVRAEHLGRDFYRIIDSMPEGEDWQYQPGQVVRCKKRNLSNGKGLVAVEEAPRAT